MPSLLISAGEASGEFYGAELIASLRKLASRQDLQFFGLGGESMRAVGADLVVRSEDVAVVGLAEVVTHLPRIYKQFRKLLAAVDKRKPAAAVLIDFPDFNLRLARELHKRGIPVIYYVSPQIWAWRPSRLKQIRRYVTKMLVILPFEAEWYGSRSFKAEYVGHPLADMAKPTVIKEDVAQTWGLDPVKPWIAILPGSRRGEVERNLPEMISAVAILGSQFEYVLPVASTLKSEWMADLVSSHWPGDEPQVHIALANDARKVLHLSRAAIVASGTATLEAALIGTPFVAVYCVAPLTWRLGRRMVRLDHFAMPNLIAKHKIVPELIQHDFTASNIVAELQKIIPEGNERSRMIADLEGVREKLTPGKEPASDRAAKAILEVLAQNS